MGPDRGVFLEAILQRARNYSIPGVIDSASESFTYNTDTSDSIPTGSLTSMAMFNSNWINYRYDSLARLKERDVGNLLTEYHTYQAGSTTGTTTMRPETFYTTAKGSSTKLTGFQYTYDAVGNITKATNQVDKSYWGYSYDMMGIHGCIICKVGIMIQRLGGLLMRTDMQAPVKDLSGIICLHIA